MGVGRDAMVNAPLGTRRAGQLRFGNMTQIHDLTVLELAAAVRQRELSPTEITGHYLDRIERLNAQTGAFYTVTADLARDQASQAEKAVARAGDPGELPPLTGVPIPIKDLNMVAGVRETLGSLAFEDNVPAEDDHVTAALRAAGAVITGKTATPEFGLPCYTETAIGPPARTPWDLSRSAGGSSGGAGAAVAAGMVPIAQGSDAAGSIRIPASFCGLFGIKPSQGRVPNAFGMDDTKLIWTSGPIARTCTSSTDESMPTICQPCAAAHSPATFWTCSWLSSSFVIRTDCAVSGIASRITEATIATVSTRVPGDGVRATAESFPT